MRNSNIGQFSESQQNKHNLPEFVKGMKLDQYVALLNYTQSDEDKEKDELLVTKLEDQSLYLQILQKKKSNFDIPQIDEENYSQSKDQNRINKKTTDTQRSEFLIHKKEQQNFLRRSSHFDENSKEIAISNSIQKKSNSKLKKQENRESPIFAAKDKKEDELLRSLYGTKYVQKFKETYQNQKIQSNIFNSTQHAQGFYLNQNKKDETYFKNLNKKQFLELQKYEKVIASKYSSKQSIESSPFSAKGQRIKEKFDTRKQNLISVRN